VGAQVPVSDSLTILIGFMAAVSVGDMCVWVASPDTIVKGSTEVLIQRQGRAPSGDSTARRRRPGRDCVSLSAYR